MVGGATPSTCNLGQTDPVGAKTLIFSRYSLEKSAAKFLYVKSFSGKVVWFTSLFNHAHMVGGDILLNIIVVPQVSK